MPLQYLYISQKLSVKTVKETFNGGIGIYRKNDAEVRRNSAVFKERLRALFS